MPLCNDNWHGGWLAYRTKREIRIDVWQIGLTFRILQIVIIGTVAYDIFIGHGWAYSEVPSSRGINAWGESTPQFERWSSRCAWIPVTMSIWAITRASTDAVPSWLSSPALSSCAS